MKGKTVSQCHYIVKIFNIYKFKSLFHTVCLKGFYRYKSLLKINSSYSVHL